MTMPNPPGRQTVAPGQIIASNWGDAVWDQTVVRFTNETQRDTEWPDPPEGAVCHIDNPAGHQVLRAGAWRWAQLEAIADSTLAGGASFPGGSLRLLGGTQVATTNAAGALVLNIPNPGTVLVTVLVDAGDDSGQASTSTFDYHPNYCQVMYIRPGGAPNVVVRVNYLALIG